MSLSKYLAPPLTSLPLCLPRYYGGVILVGVGAFGLNAYFVRRVMQARKEHNVELPIMYHPTDKLFNCIQRGHQNYLEVLPYFLMALFVGGLRYPLIISTYLYSFKDPGKRYKGSISMIGGLPMILGLLVFGVQHLVASVRCTACTLRR
ncbi:Microsomal glutathione S-transferase 3 [Schistosoma japonicum]|nr:Microsomal glutathione S-transferase 3 [Schistosoma japonicum]KAH8872402.1 Microsomal glutathione S-transferase 3 [Schistosoma japonicum]